MNKHNLFLWGGFAGVVVLVVAGLLFIPAGKEGSTQQTGEPRVVDVSDQTKGVPTAPLTLVEYSDFQCPACRAYSSLLKQVKEEFDDKLLFVYRHFPLPNHLNSVAAAGAAEAVGLQGKFWEMHDVIFENQKEWSEKPKTQAKELFTSYARELGLDMERFAVDWESKEIADKISNAQAEATRLKLNGTPTFFLNGKLISNPTSLDKFRELLNTALKP
ncbi:hypothetical protein A3I25_00745 [Candidatus Nomurabacteria bacterium RIFCSPLOWO2_02_FULL_42_17]|uniref:Thioredoxin domain-containing protein n=2 Tax=Candidatus Nomuraibacteriota TaxID=1752729 RepID=A0A1F6WID7_9BACT|nr:MAG: DSBA oxidoreductase [Parcubacteria group bacterium GW2011_GWA2_42_18]OGI81671.1 MAG: hypothetical protein A3B93_01855 [Candidatus Nomurabacteria bacterium RIFCSPHIGHO2_02_FULL_42_24]OGI96777.1 MAG: hypothetical protein A3I25_00745 [Candidatus Nomurabacteria bacterium RIFCSPLOWO2_02_FULL_42_17]